VAAVGPARAVCEEIENRQIFFDPLDLGKTSNGMRSQSNPNKSFHEQEAKQKDINCCHNRVLDNEALPSDCLAAFPYITTSSGGGIYSCAINGPQTLRLQVTRLL